MNIPIGSASSGRTTRKELVGVLAGLLLVLSAQLLVFRAFSLFSRHLWFDELHTQTLVADPNWWHSFQALRGGEDCSPPTFFLLLRVFTLPLGGPTEVNLRLFAFLSVVAGLAGLYLLLRRTFSLLVSAVTVLALWCHPLVITNAFEARFYAPWLGAIVWFAHLLARARTSSPPLLKLALGLCAVLVCTLHYFGVISLVLVAGGEYLFRPPPLSPPNLGGDKGGGRVRWNGLVVSGLGVLATLACVPLALAQRATLTVPTWVDPPTGQKSIEFLRRLILPDYLLLLALPVWFTQLYRARYRRKLAAEPEQDLTVQAGVTGLLLMSLILIAFSYAVQPVLVFRYGLASVAGLAPVVAYLLSRSGRGWVVLAGLAFLVLGGVALGAYARRARTEDETNARFADSLRQHTGDGIVVFQSPLDLYVVCHYAPDLAGRCYGVDFERADFPHASDFDLFQRDVDRNHARWYGQPTGQPLASLRRQSHFYFVPASDKDRRWPLSEAFPGSTVRPVAPGLVEISNPFGS